MLEFLINDQDAMTMDQERIATGSSVILQVSGEPDEWRLTIVNSLHADPEAARISDQCPLGEALIGRRRGDIVAVEAPGGQLECRVVSVSSLVTEYAPVGALKQQAAARPQWEEP